MEPLVLIIIIATFLLAGAVKGVIGLGLPTVSLAILTVALDLTQAMALLLVSSLLTNMWQAAVGGNLISILRRIWPFLLMATITVWIGAIALTRVDLSILSALLGLLLVSYSLVNLVGFSFSVPTQHEFWMAAAMGTANGILTGMTGSFVVPGVMFLQSIGMPRDVFIQAMGILFTISTIALAIALGTNDLLSPRLGLLSTLGIIPAFAGMIIGQRIRERLPEAMFRKVFFAALLALGVYIVGNILRLL